MNLDSKLAISDAVAPGPNPFELPFRVVPLTNLRVPMPPRAPSFWGNYLPPKFVTLLSGHGAIGKSRMAIALACHVAVGRPFFGHAVRMATVTIFTAEDDGEEIFRTIQEVCAEYGIDPDEVAVRLHLIDASQEGTVLFEHGPMLMDRACGATRSFHALKDWVVRTETELLMIDNSSEVFAANEIDRAQVKAFMRNLKSLVLPTNGSVLLLGHTDKASARGLGGTESYSGSTAWHNSARSRLSLQASSEGSVKLKHEKANFSACHAEIELSYSERGFLSPSTPLTEDEERERTMPSIVMLVRLIHEAIQKGIDVSPSSHSGKSAASLLESKKHSLGCKQKNGITKLAGRAYALGYLDTEEYVDAYRKSRQRWVVSAAGLKLLNTP